MNHHNPEPVNIGVEVSLRDYFAASAVTGILAQMSIGQTESGGQYGDPAWAIGNSGDCRIAAEGAYRVADAMLAAREKAVPA